MSWELNSETVNNSAPAWLMGATANPPSATNPDIFSPAAVAAMVLDGVSDLQEAAAQALGPFRDGTELYLNQFDYDQASSPQKTLASQAVLAALGITNAQSTTNMPMQGVRKDGTFGWLDHNLCYYSENFSQWSGNPRRTRRVGTDRWVVAKTTASSAEAMYLSSGTTHALGPKVSAILKLRAGTAAVADFGIWNGTDNAFNTLTSIAVISGPGSVSTVTNNLTRVTGLSTTEDTVIALLGVNIPASKSLNVYVYPGNQNSTTIGDSIEVTYAAACYGSSALDYVPNHSNAAVYGPPLQYNRGAASNYIAHSGDLSQSTWTKEGTATAAAGAARANGVVMSLVSGISTNGVYALSASLPLATNARYEIGLWLEKVSETGRLQVSNPNSSSSGSWSIDLSMLPSGVPVWITRKHPAVTITTEFKSHAGAGTSGGVYLVATAGTAPALSFYVAALVDIGTEAPSAYLATGATAPLHTAGTPTRQNLAVGSATQSITVQTGCTYRILHESGGTYTLSGATTGTTAAGTATTFVAASSTLTLTASGTPTNLLVHEGNATLAYVTTSSTTGAISEYPLEALRHSPAVTNLTLDCCDLTTANWTLAGATTRTAATDAQIGAYTQLRAVGASGVNNIKTASGAAVAYGIGNDAAFEPAFLLRRVSTSGALRLVSSSGGSAKGDWSINLALVRPGWNRIDRSHPAVTIATEFVTTGLGNGGLEFICASGSLDFDIAHINAQAGRYCGPLVMTAGATRALSDTTIGWTNPKGFNPQGFTLAVRARVRNDVGAANLVFRAGGTGQHMLYSNPTSNTMYSYDGTASVSRALTIGETHTYSLSRAGSVQSMARSGVTTISTAAFDGVSNGSKEWLLGGNSSLGNLKGDTYSIRIGPYAANPTDLLKIAHHLM